MVVHSSFLWSIDKITCVYACTEVAFIYSKTYTVKDDFNTTNRLLSWPLPGIEIKITDDDGFPLPRETASKSDRNGDSMDILITIFRPNPRKLEREPAGFVPMMVVMLQRMVNWLWREDCKRLFRYLAGKCFPLRLKMSSKQWVTFHLQ